MTFTFAQAVPVLHAKPAARLPSFKHTLTLTLATLHKYIIGFRTTCSMIGFNFKPEVGCAIARAGYA